MRIRYVLLTGLLALVAMAGLAAAQTTGPCPECDEDGEPDDSRYSSYDTGVIANDTGMLVDTDQSVGENEHGRFTWWQTCLSFFDTLGNSVTLMFEAFVSEDGADLDAKANVNGEEIDLEDTLVGDLDDQTWNAVEPTGLELPVDHTMLPEGQDVDECVYLDDGLQPDVTAEATASCEISA